MRILDLTMQISPHIKVFPGSPQPSFIPWSKHETHGYDSEVMFMSTHTGTHMDAPSHFGQGMPDIDMISADRLVRPALLVNVPKRKNQLIGVKDVQRKGIRENDTVVLSTGWEKHQRSDNYMTENPGLSASAATYLAERKIGAVAIDGPSIDAGSDPNFSAHRILLQKNILIVENLCNLCKIGNERFTLVIAPLKLQGATGSPVRALAIL
ncbi:MAG TPA: cyclase family protein [Nitrososphaera sp.]|jgi:kynurenine formamidase